MGWSLLDIYVRADTRMRYIPLTTAGIYCSDQFGHDVRLFYPKEGKNEFYQVGKLSYQSACLTECICLHTETQEAGSQLQHSTRSVIASRPT